MKIWIVQGRSGEYSDRREWVVDAWGSEDAAKARVAALDALLLERGYKHGSGPGDLDWDAERAAREAFKVVSGDAGFQADYTGTDYTYFESELRDAAVSALVVSSAEPEPNWNHGDMCGVVIGGKCNCYVQARREAWRRGEWPPKPNAPSEEARNG